MEHRCFGGEEEGCGEVEALLVLVAEFGVGLGDAYEGDVGVGWEVVEEALNVAVGEAYYGYADGWRPGGCFVRSEEKEREERCGDDELRRGHGRLVTVCLLRVDEDYLMMPRWLLAMKSAK